MVALLLVNALCFTVDVQSAKSSALLAVAGASIPGDLDGNNIVDIFDVILLAKSYMATPDKPNWNPNADINKDGIVDMYDAMIVSSHFGERSEQSSSADFETRTLLIPYGLTSPNSQSTLQQFARFDMLDIGFETAPDASRVKSLNPDIKIVGYVDAVKSVNASYYILDWNTINQNEDWFIHDSYGNRLEVDRNFAMNLTSGWKDFLSTSCKQLLDEYPSMDGMFLDNTWVAWRRDIWTVSKSMVPDLSSNWVSNMRSLLQAIKSKIGNKLLIINVDDRGDGRFLDLCDGEMQEGALHPEWLNATDFSWWSYVGSDPASQISNYKTLVASGKSILLYDGFLDGTGTQLERNAVLKYCYTGYLLVAESNVYYGFNSWHSDDGQKGYYPIFDYAKNLGSPSGDYYVLNGNVLGRKYANGLVVCNFDSVPHVVDLGRTYKDMQGNHVTSINLPAHTGEILLK